MKKFIIIFVIKTNKKQVSFPVYAETDIEAKEFAESLAAASENFAGQRRIKVESVVEAKTE